MGIVENSLGALDFQDSCLFVVEPSCGEWPFLGNELTLLGHRSDVVLTSFFFFSSIYHIPYLTLHFQIHYSFYNKPLSKTIHQRLALPPMQLKNPTLPTGLLFLKLPPPPCAVLLVSVNQNEAKISAAFRW